MSIEPIKRTERAAFWVLIAVFVLCPLWIEPGPKAWATFDFRVLGSSLLCLMAVMTTWVLYRIWLCGGSVALYSIKYALVVVFLVVQWWALIVFIYWCYRFGPTLRSLNR
jgi:hypothetical protein